jgi:predicted ArsR family transcriptional regulator
MSTDAHARRHDRTTSHAAAASVRPTGLEQTVLDALAQFPEGATSFELAAVLDLSLVTVSPRLKPLVTKGHVVEAGQRRGQSRRMHTVWKLAPPKPLIRFDERGQGTFL